MANINVPRGLIPYRYRSGSVYNGAANAYYVPASYGSNIFVGDPVVLVDNSADGVGIPTVALATLGGAGNFILGAMVGIVPGGEPQIPVTRDQPVYHQASTAGYILVSDDPLLMYEVQEDSVGGALAAGAAGRNVNLSNVGGGSTVTGYSGVQLQSASLNASNTLQMHLERLLEQADNAQGVNAKWLCRINLSSGLNQTGT